MGDGRALVRVVCWQAQGVGVLHAEWEAGWDRRKLGEKARLSANSEATRGRAAVQGTWDNGAHPWVIPLQVRTMGWPTRRGDVVGRRWYGVNENEQSRSIATEVHVARWQEGGSPGPTDCEFKLKLVVAKE